MTARHTQPILDPSTRYRCYHLAEALRGKGYRCVVVSLSEFLKHPSYIYDAYVFHRPNVGDPRFEACLDDLRRLNKILVADYDDLIFGEAEEALTSSVFKNGLRPAEQITEIFRKNLAALTLFEKFTTSTGPLREQVLRHKPDGHCAVVPNALPESVLAISREKQFHLEPRPSNVVGYFAGTKSHDKDLPIAEEGLLGFLDADPEGKLLVVGPVTLPDSLLAHKRVEQRGVVDYLQLPLLMRQCSSVIAPLERTIFNDCKSRVKFLEASLAGCRLVATPIPDIGIAAEGWASLPKNSAEWVSALTHRDDERQRSQRASATFAYLNEQCHADRSAEIFLKVLEN